MYAYPRNNLVILAPCTIHRRNNLTVATTIYQMYEIQIGYGICLAPKYAGVWITNRADDLRLSWGEYTVVRIVLVGN